MPHFQIDGLMQKEINSSALAMELSLFFIKPSINEWQWLCLKIGHQDSSSINGC